MKILITCFEPFGKDSANASQQAVELLPDLIGINAIKKVLLPVSFNRCGKVIAEAIKDTAPDLVIMTGQAARDSVCLERLAINWAISRIPDKDGVIATGEKIYPDAPDAIFTTFPVDIIASSLVQQTGQSIKASNTAGTFVCNRLYFDVLHNSPTIPALFIHLPLTPARVAVRGTSTPSLPTDLAVTILQRIIHILPSYIP